MSLDALKKKAQKALMDGKYDVALPLYEQLHKLDEEDLRTFTKVAEMKEKTGDGRGALRAYTAIAKAYADDGFVVQAIAINKLILRLDPNQTEINEKLKDLSSERGDDWAISTMAAFSADSIPVNTHDKSKLNFERTPLLSGLAGQELEDFIKSLELKEYAAGDVIFKVNGEGNSLYLIGMGSVRLETKSVRGEKQTFSTLTDGDFFGELSFMSKTKHMDSAIAETDVNLLIINRKIFDDWVKKYPSIHETVEDFYRHRVLARILAITPVFEGIPQEARIPLAEQFSFSFYRDGDTIINEGDVDNTFFLIRSGQIEVFTRNKKKEPPKKIMLGKMGEGSFFGEVSMLTNRPRTASVTAIGDVELMTLSSEKFKVLTKQFPTVQKIVEAYLKHRVKSTIQTLKDNT